jgi:hypothetical protein
MLNVEAVSCDTKEPDYELALRRHLLWPLRRGRERILTFFFSTPTTHRGEAKRGGCNRG